ncbi:B-cell receptor CD22 [Fundulus heteroclitus]|uniref:B-cell receptor CD22 n=1 Tax=Fundulus heteroclitus TaxID=8078 RepID=UPI00165CBB24|nr:B-cell receptor CD22 [Fundulus heteroclitus]
MEMLGDITNIRSSRVLSRIVEEVWQSLSEPLRGCAKNPAAQWKDDVMYIFPSLSVCPAAEDWQEESGFLLTMKTPVLGTFSSCGKKQLYYNCVKVLNLRSLAGVKESKWCEEDDQNQMAALCESVLAVNMLLSIFFLPDSPWSPSINIPADLKEHQSVTISCSALTPCPHSPPELTWNLQQDSHRQTEKNTEGTFTTKIQETITLSDTHDGYNISCSATYPVNGGNKTAETEVTLSVSYAPRDTSASISPSGLVSAGSWVELSCSSRAKPPASFTWFRNSKHGAINVSVGQVYSFNATEGGEYYCVATNDLGDDASSTVCASIKDSPWSPSINIPADLKEHQCS